MKVLYHLRYRHSTGADRWIAETWQVGFQYLGHQVEFFDGKRIDAKAILASGADLFMTDICTLNAGDAKELCALRQAGTKVALWVHWPLVPVVAHMTGPLVLQDIADVYFGEREPEGMADFETATGRKYVTIANAARHDIHKPAAYDKDYAYDIAFVGARLPHKKWFNDLIKDLRRNYHVGVFGPGWTMRDKVIGFIARATRKLGLTMVSAPLDRLRISLPLEKEPVLYASSKICINFHERESDGSLTHNIVNQRFFKIAASGGLQIVDAVPGAARYFSEHEIVALPLDKSEWLSKIDEMLANEALRNAMQKNATNRAQREHYSHHRVAQLLEKLGDHIIMADP